MIPNAIIEAYVLAGGKSSRMGKDKGLISLKDRPMISYVLKALTEMSLPIKIIANTPGYETFGYPVMKDELQGKGPLGGLYTAFQNSFADYVLLVGCDMPLVSTEAFCRLMDVAEKGKIAVAAQGAQMNPLFALYPRELKAKVKQQLDVGELKMTDFISGNPHILVTSIGEKLPWALQNINDKDELQEVEEKWGHLL